MGTFLLREVFYNNIKTELTDIGFDSSYLGVISDKFCGKNIRIYNLSVAQANILKQTALIFGADCAVNKNVITGEVGNTDVILCGSVSQLKKIASKLRTQPFKLAILGNEILVFLEPKRKKTKLAGILNITPDSFSDGGLYFNPDDAKRQLIQLVQDGADMVDIGAESTRPNSVPVNADEQIRRLKAVLNGENYGVTISVDTRSSEVADFALNNGAGIINDVSGLEYDSRMTETVAKYNAGMIIQHSKGNAEDTPVYQNVVEEVYSSLHCKVICARNAGIDNIIVDPGIGFGKVRQDNLTILKNINAFSSLACPLMVGISRKRFLNAETEDNETKDALSLAHSYPLVMAGVDYLRVHNVKLHKLLLNSIPD